jgi:hypothetical protein
METFVVSDLARNRRQVVDAARRKPVRIRDADGTMLVLTTEAQAIDNALLLSYFEIYLRTSIECTHDAPNRVLLGPVSYISDWTKAQRQMFLDDFLEALSEASRTHTATPVTTFIDYFAPKPGRVSPLVDPDVLSRLGDALAAR